MKKILFTPLFVVILLYSYTGTPLFASAADLPVTGSTNVGDISATALPDFKPLTPIQGTPFESVFGADATLTGFFQTLFNLSITIGALLAVLMLAWSGYQYLFTDVVKMKGDAKQRIQNALLGLLMLLATVLILRQINPDIVSLKILNNTGTSNIPTQTNPSQGSASGARTTTPQGFCIDTGSKQIVMGQWGVGSMQESYLCYNTLAECGVHGLNNCDAYSTAYNDAYSSGSGRDTPLPSQATDYQQRVYIANPGTDGSGNIQRCNAGTVKGTGWVDLNPALCGAISGSSGICCGLPKNIQVAATSTVSGEKFGVDEQQYIQPGSWCYVDTTNTYSCFTAKNLCGADLAIATSTNKASNGSKCLVRTNTQTWTQTTTQSTGNTTAPTTNSYSNYHYATQQQIDAAAASPINACASLYGTGYVEVPVNSCPSSVNPFGSTTGKCCALPNN